MRLNELKMHQQETAFAFLDSSYKVPQHLQMLAFRDYSEKNNLHLAFYGGELVGEEERDQRKGRHKGRQEEEEDEWID